MNTLPTQGGFLEIPNDDVLTNCMHCGLCLPVCPTYNASGLERSSPRGRIRLIRNVASGEGTITTEFAEEMNYCLDCQACETACPAGVKYGSLVVAARSMIYDSDEEGWVSRRLKRTFLGNIFGSRKRLYMLARLLRFYQRSGLAWFVEKSGFLNLLPGTLAKTHPLTPRISRVFSAEIFPDRLPAIGEKRWTVGFLPGCIMDVAFSGINIETVELLRKSGCEVVIPKTQACCGSLAGHNGDTESARKLAGRTVDAFKALPLDYIVMNSAGCGAFMKEYGEVLRDDPLRHHDAEILANRTLDLTEFLVRIGWVPAGQPHERERALRVTYHDACHLAHSQSVSTQPRDLLRSIHGIEYIELPEASWCCGSAGIYNVVRYADSRVFLDRKLRNIEQVLPDLIVTGNPGCMIQIEHGLRERGIDARVVHTATFLNRYSDER